MFKLNNDYDASLKHLQLALLDSSPCSFSKLESKFVFPVYHFCWVNLYFRRASFLLDIWKNSQTEIPFIFEIMSCVTNRRRLENCFFNKKKNRKNKVEKQTLNVSYVYTVAITSPWHCATIISPIIHSIHSFKQKKWIFFSSSFPHCPLVWSAKQTQSCKGSIRTIA